MTNDEGPPNNEKAMTNDECLMTGKGTRVARPFLRHSSFPPACAGGDIRHSSLPFVTCLCPTYGRFELLRESLACFLAQDYPNKRLIILNDGPEPIRLSENLTITARQARFDWGADVEVINSGTPYPTLGEKRAALLQASTIVLAAHWDDDDLYLPWHLSDCVAKLREGWACTKLRRTIEWRVGEAWRWHNAGNDGSMVFDRLRALSVGGYPPRQVGQNIGLLRKFEKAGTYAPVDQQIPSVVVRRFPGHNFGVKSAEAFREANRDFGDGRPLTPADLAPIWDEVIEGTRIFLTSDNHAELERRLRRV